ncbi:hybrid sensor histidine kinase/response regulator [Aquabacterium sp. OR-4]|uniref:hybrid sensor histidine kinase/response regulator n=1 Tax=Aquabacterium sp. OR-4 TaxID=2978127 RepID=UPI0021B31893|nr:hybrid sensor histidine kinase/response regulator [Aquabacterium sp. OR-4]MDT7835089.1 hybrid sensor histidine kinase/response regulator [Aquabacterium sp. OR-4]
MTHPPAKILVVDDTASNLMVMQALLARDDVQVLTARSGPEALELLLLHDVALALLDVQMPEMDGPALATLMRGTERTRLVPIIFVTAIDPDPQRRYRGYEAGAVDFVYKPVEPVVLRSKVEVFLSLHRQQRELDARMRELERAVALNQMVIGSLSHDIRTPLAALTLNAELVMRRAENPAVQEAGQRIKAAIGMLGRQIDHLVNLASLTDGMLEPRIADGDLPTLVRERAQACLPGLLEAGQLQLNIDGDAALAFDPTLVTQALDQLMILMAAHRGEQTVQLQIDGHARRLVLLRLHTPAVLPEAVQAHLFGGGPHQPGVAGVRVGPGLALVERIARSHGGSLIGRSRARDGTLFELMLPRQPGGGAP